MTDSINYPQRAQKPSPQRGTNPPTRDVNAATRAVKALQLRAEKLTYEEIAHRTGFSTASSCRKAVLRELHRVVVTNVEELRREESALLDKLHAEVWALAMDRKSKGRMYAIDRVLAISEARRRLFGLDAKNDDIMAGVTIIREYSVEVSKV